MWTVIASNAMTQIFANVRIRRSRVKYRAKKVIQTKLKAFKPKGASMSKSANKPVPNANQTPHHVG